MKARRSKEQNEIVGELQGKSHQYLSTMRTWELIEWLDEVCKMHDYYKQELEKNGK